MITKFKKAKKPSSFQAWFFSALLIILFLVIVGSLIFSNLRVNQKRTELTAKIEKLKEEIAVLGERNQALQSGIAQTYQEDYWKEKLYEQGYVEKGEQQVVILPPKEEEVEKEEEKSFWNPQAWWEWLKDKVK